MHLILARLEATRWLQSRWEQIDPSAEGWPARSYCRLNLEAEHGAGNAVAVSYQSGAAGLGGPEREEV